MAVGVDLVNTVAHHHVPDLSSTRARAAFEDHGYRAPATAREWNATTELARDIAALLSLVADRDHVAAVAMMNARLAAARVTPYIEQRGSGWVLHFHLPDADFTDGWAAGIAAALAITYSTDDADRIGRCTATGCHNLFLDRGRNKQRRFCSLRCQNRTKSATYRDQRPSRPPSSH